MRKSLFQTFLFLSISISSMAQPLAKPDNGTFEISGKSFDLTQAEERKALKIQIEKLLTLLEDNQRPESGNYPEYFLQNDDVSDKKIKRSLALIKKYLEEQENGFDRQKSQLILEIHRSLELNMVSPTRDHYSLGTIAGIFIQDLVYTQALHGNKPSKIGFNLWQEKETEKLDLTLGFGRNSLPIDYNDIAKYDEPKTGYGTQPGYVIKYKKKKIKIKFKETKSEPFATRILWAMGYNVDPVDYIPFAKVKYDRKILTEYNSRKKMMMKITTLGITLKNKAYAVHRDPLSGMSEFVLKDGKTIPEKDLATFIYKNPKLEHPELVEGNFNEENEERIDYIVTKEAQIQESTDAVRVGPWSYNDFDHQHYREVRGLVLFAAWLNWYDARFDNNRLLIMPDENGEDHVKFYLNDVGSVLGKVVREVHAFQNSHGDLENFPDRFTTRRAGKFRFKKFRVMDKNLAFRNSTIDDVVWMAKLILRLSPEQIEQALKGSGFSQTEVKGFLDKILSRRDYMKKDLKELRD